MNESVKGECEKDDDVNATVRLLVEMTRVVEQGGWR